MGKYLVVKPTTVSPPFDTAESVYREGDEFEVDERENAVRKYIDELGDVVLKADSAKAKLWLQARAETEGEEPEPEPKEPEKKADK